MQTHSHRSILLLAISWEFSKPWCQGSKSVLSLFFFFFLRKLNLQWKHALISFPTCNPVCGIWCVQVSFNLLWKPNVIRSLWTVDSINSRMNNSFNLMLYCQANRNRIVHCVKCSFRYQEYFITTNTGLIQVGRSGSKYIYIWCKLHCDSCVIYQHFNGLAFMLVK